jgi:hypothetical protein
VGRQMSGARRTRLEGDGAVVLNFAVVGVSVGLTGSCVNAAPRAVGATGPED